jgi:hypothetical protein
MAVKRQFIAPPGTATNFRDTLARVDGATQVLDHPTPR